MGNLSGWHLLALLIIILLLFGAAKLPALAKGLGQSARVFKGEMKAMKEEDDSATDVTTSPVDPSISAPAPAPRSDAAGDPKP